MVQRLAAASILCLMAVIESSSQPASATVVLEAVRVNGAILVDGRLPEPVWQRPGYTGFTQREPDQGAPASQKTEVWIAYDDGALYVAARLHDTSPDSIVARVGRRDAELSSDWLYFAVDAYHDKRNAFFFGVTPAGSISDGTFFNDEHTEGSWDGVWEVATTIDSGGWVAEFRIPYSQLRFPNLEEYIWGINFLRRIDRRSEESWLVMVPKGESGGVSRFADLVGIKNINPPRTFEVLPYVASAGKSLQHDPGDPFKSGLRFSHSVGADIKWGFGSNLTLNATVNPDFGQVEVDPAVVNLTQYETFYEEKRPFFVQGASFFQFGTGGVNSNWNFNWSNPSYFYSRRVGRAPCGEVQHDGFEDIPDRTHIIGAAKLTGKLTDGWSLGVVQAVTAREYGKVDDGNGNRYSDVVEPLAYYGVVRSLREFQDGAKAVGVIATVSMRDLNQPYLLGDFNRRSYTFGIDGWTNIDSNRTWVATGWLSTTRVEGSKERMIDLQRSSIHRFQRPDADYVRVDSQATSLVGYAGRVAVNKQRGNLRFNAGLGTISPGFNSNDLGFHFRTDIINSHVMVGYQWYDPDGTFRQKGFNVATYRNYSYGGNKFAEGYFFFYNMQLMNYWSIEGSAGFYPAVMDDRLTRGGPVMRTTNGCWFELYGSTDWRAPLVGRLGLYGGRSESGGYTIGVTPGIEWKPNSRITLSFRPDMMYDVTIAQWVENIDDATATHTYGRRHVFARLDRHDVSANIRIDWTFTPKLSLQVFAQPFFSVGTYTEFKELAQPGTYTFNRYGEGGSTIERGDGEYAVDPDGPGPAPRFYIEDPDYNYKSFRTNIVLRWEYLPGSTMYLVWTHDRTSEDDPGIFRFRRDFSNLFSSTPNNVFLLKVAYWLNP